MKCAINKLYFLQKEEMEEKEEEKSADVCIASGGLQHRGNIDADSDRVTATGMSVLTPLSCNAPLLTCTPSSIVVAVAPHNSTASQ